MPKKTPGRPKGSTSIGVPSKSIIEARDLVVQVYRSIEDASASRSDIANILNLKDGNISPTLGVLNEYGLLERTSTGLRVSDLGKRVVNNDIDAIKEALEKNGIFKDLSNHFSEENITPGVIIEYLKKYYKKGSNVVIIAGRFLEAINYIKQSKLSGMPVEKKDSKETSIDWLKVMQLKYALSPPKQDELHKLTEAVVKELKSSGDGVMISLAEQMKINIDNKDVLNALVSSIVDAKKVQRKNDVYEQ